MTLAYAERCAAKLTEWLAPHAVKLVVAGSLRRRKETVGDLDLVCISSHSETLDMFGEVVARKNSTWEEIERRCKADGWRIERAGSEIVTFHAREVQVDVFWATESTWGSILVQRTGSKEHNIWLSQYAMAQGGKWLPNIGLYLGGRRYSESEEAIYRGLGVDPIPPEKREAHLLPFASLCRTYSPSRQQP